MQDWFERVCNSDWQVWLLIVGLVGGFVGLCFLLEKLESSCIMSRIKEQTQQSATRSDDVWEDS